MLGKEQSLKIKLAIKNLERMKGTDQIHELKNVEKESNELQKYVIQIQKLKIGISKNNPTTIRSQIYFSVFRILCPLLVFVNQCVYIFV